jgi:hypothetical protein
MGILGGPLEFLREIASNLPQGFSVCELGDQWITHGTPHRLAKDFYMEDLKCSRYVSIDGNGRGTLTADLNLPLPPSLGQFDIVTDFGTGEHLFDQRQVFKSIHLLTKMGGYFVFDRPCQGYAVHCYWLANRCVYEDFAATNNYEILKLEETDTSRGKLLRGVFRRRGKNKFIVPQQGRYRKLLRPLELMKKA